MLTQTPPQTPRIEKVFVRPLIEISQTTKTVPNEEFFKAIDNADNVSNFLEDRRQQIATQTKQTNEYFENLKKLTQANNNQLDLLKIQMNECNKTLATLISNAFLQQIIKQQQNSISELRSWIIGLFVGGVGCGATALLVWLWYHTHKQ